MTEDGKTAYAPHAWGPAGKQKGAQREVQQEEYCNPGVISLSPIRSQVDRPVLLPCLPLPRPSPSLPFLPSLS